MGSGYSIPNAQTNHAGGYTVVVSSSFGSLTSSPPAVLIVNVPPTITQQPVSQTILAGATATFSVTASVTAPFTCIHPANPLEEAEAGEVCGCD